MRDLQIKTMRYYPILLRMAMIKKAKNNKCWARMWRKGNPNALLAGIELPYDLAILLLVIYPKKTKTLTLKVICTPMFTESLLTITKTWKQPKCPSMDGKINCGTCIYTYI